LHRFEISTIRSLQSAEEWAVRKVSLELARKVLTETQARVKAGVMPAMETLNAEFGVAVVKKDLIDAERAAAAIRLTCWSPVVAA
jgi:outer membrane protein